MKSVRSLTRSLVVAALTLPTAGCGGCHIEVHDGDAVMQEFAGQLYKGLSGPEVLASGIGAAAPPGGSGGLSVLATEAARRAWLERKFNRPFSLAAVAGIVSAAAPPGGCGGLSALATITAGGQGGEDLGRHYRLPPLFEAHGLDRQEEAARPAQQ